MFDVPPCKADCSRKLGSFAHKLKQKSQQNSFDYLIFNCTVRWENIPTPEINNMSLGLCGFCRLVLLNSTNWFKLLGDLKTFDPGGFRDFCKPLQHNQCKNLTLFCTEAVNNFRFSDKHDKLTADCNRNSVYQHVKAADVQSFSMPGRRAVRCLKNVLYLVLCFILTAAPQRIHITRKNLVQDLRTGTKQHQK